MATFVTIIYNTHGCKENKNCKHRRSIRNECVTFNPSLE